jgi:hypothetical protein
MVPEPEPTKKILGLEEPIEIPINIEDIRKGDRER